MKALEEIAREDWEMGNVSEFVALGFIDPKVVASEDAMSDGDIVWFGLTNEQERDEVGRQTEFHVSGDQLVAVFEEIFKLEQGSDPSYAEMSKWDRVLWHSHPYSVQPSPEDVRDFPAGLCSVGIVYHAPSGASTLYNNSGVISPLVQVDPAHLTTG